MGQFRPGERVVSSAIYRVFHDSHRLMHEAALREDDIFPRCKRCGSEVRFELLRPAKSESVVPFRDGEILEECPRLAKPHKHAG
ncbi:MAG TPA: hypothetical protein VFR84_16780 [Candidatus Angelobacter sp.]|nr:hypothetical protein [Candidatus Angelobacter sp.]